MRALIWSWAFVAAVAIATPGGALLFGSFFFERWSDWPQNLLAFVCGAALLSAAVLLARWMVLDMVRRDAL